MWRKNTPRTEGTNRMKREIMEQMRRIMDEQGYNGEFGGLLDNFIREKAQEPGSWSDIVLGVHGMLGGCDPFIQRLAAAGELLVLASDIMDDLQDQDHQDKGWMQCPPAFSINALVAMLMGFMGELGDCRVRPQALVEISRIIARAIRGQQKDIANEARDADDYLKLTVEKSGSLFRLMLFLGSSSVDSSSEQLEILYDLADCTGLIHQIQNDIRDVSRVELKNDMALKRRTLPILYLLSVDSPDFKLFQQYYQDEVTKEQFLASVEDIDRFIENSGCVEYCFIVQAIIVDKAEELLGRLEGEASEKEHLRQLLYGAFVQ